MRTLYNLRVPDGARLVEVRAFVGSLSRSRVIFRGPLEEHDVPLTEDAIADVVASNTSVWEWISAQIKQRRISIDSGSDGTVVKFKLSLSFINQDNSKAILDESSGTTSMLTEEAWEFHKGSASGQNQVDPIVTMDRLVSLVMEQQKELPNQISKMLSIVVESGKAAIQTSAAESSKILQASIEPLKAQTVLIEKFLNRESERLDNAHGAVINLLTRDDKKADSPVDEVKKFLDMIPMLLNIIDKLPKPTS